VWKGDLPLENIPPFKRFCSGLHAKGQTRDLKPSAAVSWFVQDVLQLWSYCFGVMQYS